MKQQEPQRKRLPDLRPSYTCKIVSGNFDIYVSVGFFDDDMENLDKPGEVFVKVGKFGGDVAVFVDGWAQMVSIALQYGVPWSKIESKYRDSLCPNLLQAVVAGVNRCIEERRKTVGLDE